MFGILKKEANKASTTQNKNSSNIKIFEKPKIMFIDFSSNDYYPLINFGFNISSGTFGFNYKTSMNECEAHLSHNLPSFMEQDILIINAEQPDVGPPIDSLNSDNNVKSDRQIIIKPSGQNYFNPRPFVGSLVNDKIERILNHGGILITFSAPKYKEKYITGEIRNGHIEQYTIKDFNIPNYSFSPFYCNIKHGSGKEIRLSKNIFTPLLEKYLKDFYFNTIFNVSNEKDIILAVNKYNDTVSFIRPFVNERHQEKIIGWYLVLPAIKNKNKFLFDLFTEYLPLLSPKLFPEIENNSWLELSEYQMPSVKKLITQKESITSDYLIKLEEIEKEIQEEKSRYNFITGILTSDAYDKKLVSNISYTLSKFGYKNIIDLDEGKENEYEEDLQIRDNEGLTVLEIKGLTGFPTESDCNQVLKYVNRRNNEENRNDVKGIFIVNHQRNLPPYERDLEPFTPKQVNDAIYSSYSLVTTYDIYKAYLLFEKGQLIFNDINSALHKPGRVKFLPFNWSKIGRITHLYPNAGTVRIELERESLKIGEIIGYINDDSYLTQKVESIQVDNKDIEEGFPGQHLGVRFNEMIDKKLDIYIVR